MPSIRLPDSAAPLLPFCRRHGDPFDNACFDTYADLVTFTASCGFHRLNGRSPSEPKTFLKEIYPIDIAVFKNQDLFPNLLLIALGAEATTEVAQDEERLCRLIETFADAGCKHLSHQKKSWGDLRFHLEAGKALQEGTAVCAKGFI